MFTRPAFSQISVYLSVFMLILLASCRLPLDLKEEKGITTDSRLYSLTGPWKLYPGELCTGADCEGQPLEDAPLLLEMDNPPRSGTYVMTLVLPDAWKNTSLGIQLFDVGSAYRLFIDGVDKGGRGKPSTSADQSVPDSLPALFQFRAEQNLTIAVQFSNFAHPRGGLRQAPILGPDQLALKNREQSILRNVLALGVILGMAFYHFGLFLNRKEDRASLLFGLVCFFWSVRMLFTDEVMIRSFLDLGYELQTAIEYISFIMAGPLFVSFLAATFPFRGANWLAWTNVTFGILASAFVAFAPAILYADYLPFFQGITLISVISSLLVWIVAVTMRAPGSLTSLLGGVLACLAAVNDVLYYRRESPVGPIFHYGLLVFILAQSYLLARLFARTYEGIKTLSENLKNTNASLARFVPTEFLRFLNREDITQVQLGDQVHDSMTVMFTDIRSFTELSEKMSPEENFNFLNSYLRRMTPIVNNQEGFVDKYIGDAVMALFPGKSDDSLRAAIEMQREIRVYNRHRALKGYQPISIGVGIHTGDTMLGVIGHENRMEGTVISDTVNTASRIERLTRKYGVMILISEQTLNSLEHPEDFTVRLLGRVKVKGRTNPFRIYHLLDGYSEDIRSLYLSTSDIFQDAVELALAGKYEPAADAFEEVLAINPMDTAAHFYLERMRRAGVVKTLD